MELFSLKGNSLQLELEYPFIVNLILRIDSATNPCEARHLIRST